MIIIPAIDIINGNVVRLCEGDYSSRKEYKITPMEAAENFCKLGAEYLHVVDLDGAKSGKCDNAETIKHIVTSHNIKVEVGGGIRTLDQIKNYIDCGVSRVIIGTAAVNDIKFVETACCKYGNKVAVGVDAKDGKVCSNGWTKITEIDSLSFCKKLCDIGIDNIIYTDISKDGMLSGTNTEIYDVLCQTLSCKITASGGISSLGEIRYLARTGVYGAILGKAIYENKINLSDAIAVANDK